MIVQCIWVRLFKQTAKLLFSYHCLWVLCQLFGYLGEGLPEGEKGVLHEKWGENSDLGF